MGTNVSAVVTTNITRTVNRATVSAQQEIVNSNTSTVDNNQTVTLVLEKGATFSCGSLSINQEASTSMRALSKASGEQKLDMASIVTQAVQAAAKIAMDQKNEELSLLQNNIAVAVNTAITETENEQTVSLIQKFENIITQTSSTNQTIQILVGEEASLIVAGDCTFNQKSSIEYTSEMTTIAAIEAVLRQESVQNAMIEWDTAIKQTNKGVNLALILGIVAGILVLLIIIGCLGGLLPPYLKKKAAEKAARDSLIKK